MVRSHFTLKTPPRFHFWRTVYSHGWCALPPFRVDKDKHSLSLLLELKGRALVLCTLSERPEAIAVRAVCARKLRPAKWVSVKHLLSDCFRMTEDFSDFYAEARRYPAYRWIPSSGAGRLLRSPTVFEDTVKMICTTNCSWSLTEIMIGNLMTHVGRKFSDGFYSFPAPHAIAGLSEAFIRKNIRAGYRSPYLLELADRVASGKLDVESWRTSPLPTSELFKQVRSVKGIGEYAAGNLLKLLGRYDFLGLDSWVRTQFFRLHTNGRPVSDKMIEKHYAQLGKWRGLFFWLEMTRHWQNHKFPF